MAPYDDFLPELTETEKEAVELVDMTRILGTPEQRIKVCSDAAIRFFRQRNEAREAARWCFVRVYRQSEALEKWPWLQKDESEISLPGH